MSKGEGREVITGGGAYVEGEINTVGGDFIGRDTIVYGERSTVDVRDIEITGFTIDVVPPAKLRGRITRAISVCEALNELKSSTATYQWYAMTSFLTRILSRQFVRRLAWQGRQDQEFFNYALKELRIIENERSPDMSEEELRLNQQKINSLSDTVNVRFGRLHTDFIGSIRAASATPNLVKTMVDDINHPDLNKLSQSHLEAVKYLWKELDIQSLATQGFDVLTDTSISAIKILTEIENRKMEIQRLINRDQKRNNLTVTLVIVYIAIVILLAGWLIWDVSTMDVIMQEKFNSLQLPLINIPASVITWSLIGSLAAMLIRFNREPIYNFGDTVKWLLTRPVQGVILGAGFYIVLTSGLFVLTGDPSSVTGSSNADNIILLVLFLVGFSDRFADTVFNALIKRLSNTSAEAISRVDGEIAKNKDIKEHPSTANDSSV